MADLVITAADVLPGASARIAHVIWGAAVTAGKAVYEDPTTKKWLLADADSATPAAREAGGIALNSGADGQPGTIIKSGDVTLGAVLTAGAAYYLSGAAAGAICPLADVGAGEYICQLGLAKSASVLALNIQFPNVASA